MNKQQFFAMSLRHKLCVISKHGNSIGTLTAVCGDSDFIFRSVCVGGREKEMKHIEETLPILYPLSDLTKPITHNGETFVPMEIIGKIIESSGAFEDGFFGWNQATGGDDYQDYYLEISKDLKFAFWCGRKDEGGYIVNEENIHFDIALKLIEWHFNLMDESEPFIDVNTLEINPYK